jgi:hypothetical protein
MTTEDYEEDYVSSETAELLKEKGFDVNVANSWHIVPSETCNLEDLEKFICGDINEPEYSEDYYPMITLQMAMKWLRKKKGIAIIPILSSVLDGEKFLWDIKIVVAKHYDVYSQGWVYEDLEEAYEAALKYCLKNLI